MVYIHEMKENEIRKKKEITGVVGWCVGGMGVRNEHPSRKRRRRVMPLPHSKLRYGYVVRQRNRQRKEKGERDNNILTKYKVVKKKMWCLQRKE